MTRTATLEFMKTHQQNAEFRIRAAAAAEGGGRGEGDVRFV